MRNNILLFVFFASLTFVGCAQKKAVLNVNKELTFAAKQYENMLATHQDVTQFPQSTKPNGEMYNRTADWWCSGFFGGSLWYLYEFTKDDKWKAAADKWTVALDKEK